MDLSIVIVSWNVADLLANCLKSIYAHPPSSGFEVWVVDNDSNDGTVERVKENYPQVKLIVNQENVGFAAANNQAIAQSHGKYVLMLNPDTVVHEESIQLLIDFLNATPQAAAAGSMLLSPDGSSQQSCMPFPTVFRELWRLCHLDVLRAYGVYDIEHWGKTEPREVDSLQGASLMLRRSALEQTGLLDPAYFMYTEEVDLCYRLHQNGWKMYWLPQSVVTHFGGQSTRQVALKMFLNLYASKIMFFRKHYGERKAREYKFVIGLGSRIRLVSIPVAAFLQPSQKKKYNEIQSNYKQLIKKLPLM